MAGLDLAREDDGGRHGRYVGRIEGVEGEAELTYTRHGPGRISAEHTGVPPTMAGMGVGRALVLRLVEDARREGVRIVPACSFVAAQFRRHPDWADLLAAP